MKEHAESYAELQNYILRYKVKGNNIVSKLANGEKYVVPNTEGNVRRIDSIMENQARNAKKEKTIWARLLSVASLIGLPFAAHAYFTSGNLGLLFSLLLSCSVVTTTFSIIEIIKNRDVEKLQFFLNHREEINENAYKTENVKLGVRRKAAKQLTTQAVKKEPAVNLCNIDYYSLGDLRKIRRNIGRYNAFELEETPIQSESGPVLRRNITNQN